MQKPWVLRDSGSTEPRPLPAPIKQEGVGADCKVKPSLRLHPGASLPAEPCADLGASGPPSPARKMRPNKDNGGPFRGRGPQEHRGLLTGPVRPPRPPAEGTVPVQEPEGLQVGRGRAALHAGGPGGKVWLEGALRDQAHLLPSVCFPAPCPTGPRAASLLLSIPPHWNPRLRGGPRTSRRAEKGGGRTRTQTCLPHPRARGRPSLRPSLQPECAAGTPRGDAAAPEGPQAAGPRANPLPPLRELERRAPGSLPSRAARTGAGTCGGGRGGAQGRRARGARGHGGPGGRGRRRGRRGAQGTPRRAGRWARGDGAYLS